MILRFFYEGPTPSKKNGNRPFVNKSTGRAFLARSKEYLEWLPGAVLEMKLQMSRQPGRFPIQKCKSMFATLYFPNMRQHDNDNMWTTIKDLVVKAGILKDDAWFITGATGQFPSLRRDQPGWVLTIETADPAPGPAEVHNNIMPTAAGARV